MANTAFGAWILKWNVLLFVLIWIAALVVLIVFTAKSKRAGKQGDVYIDRVNEDEQMLEPDQEQSDNDFSREKVNDDFLGDMVIDADASGSVEEREEKSPVTRKRTPTHGWIARRHSLWRMLLLMHCVLAAVCPVISMFWEGIRSVRYAERLMGDIMHETPFLHGSPLMAFALHALSMIISMTVWLLIERKTVHLRKEEGDFSATDSVEGIVMDTIMEE